MWIAWWVGLYRLAPKVLDALKILPPETVVRWRRADFRAYWRWRLRWRGSRPKISADIRQLILLVEGLADRALRQPGEARMPLHQSMLASVAVDRAEIRRSPMPYGTKTPDEGATIRAITITNDILWRFPSNRRIR
jgi:hypothetical protein